MGNLFTQKNQYDDDGNLMVNQVTAMESGTFTKSITAANAGAISNIYDGLSTTGITMLSNNPNTTYYVKWDMGRKMKFKNIYVFGSIDGASTNYLTLSLKGSLDNVTWTTIDSGTQNGAALINYNLLATNVTYRYIKVEAAAQNTNGEINLYEIKAVL